MEPSTHDRSTVEKYLATARERLISLETLLEARGPEAGVLRVAVVSALGALNDAHAVVVDPRDAARVACSYCGYRIMSDASLCLSCWSKRDAKGDAKRDAKRAA